MRWTTGQSDLHDSVSSQDVLIALQERGIQLGDIQGEFVAQNGNTGIENGRMKSVGEYIFILKLQNKQTPVITQVVRDQEVN